MAKRRNFTDQFKAKVALEALRGDKTVQEIAAKHQLHPNQVSTWKRQAIDGMAEAMRLSAEDVFFNWTPLYHDMGLVNNYLTCLLRGLPLVMMSNTDFVKRPALWLRGLADTGANITWSPNFGFCGKGCYPVSAQRRASQKRTPFAADHKQLKYPKAAEC